MIHNLLPPRHAPIFLFRHSADGTWNGRRVIRGIRMGTDGTWGMRTRKKFPMGICRTRRGWSAEKKQTKDFTARGTGQISLLKRPIQGKPYGGARKSVFSKRQISAGESYRPKKKADPLVIKTTNRPGRGREHFPLEGAGKTLKPAFKKRTGPVTRGKRRPGETTKRRRPRKR